MMKILIVDDERLARQRLHALVEEIGIGEVVGEAENGHDALSMAHAYQPDVVLLDIRMPGLDGIKAAEVFNTRYPHPFIIFTTAYEEHALKAFEYQAVDYLVKPIRKARLQQALLRVRELLAAREGVHNTEELKPSARTHISVNIRGQLTFVPVEDIMYFLADEKYVMVYTHDTDLLISETLKSLEQEFSGQFLRIHRSTLVSIIYIEALLKDEKGRWQVKLKNKEILLEVSRRHLPTVRKILRDIRLSP